MPVPGYVANTETTIRKDGITKWKGNSATVFVPTTLGFTEGGFKYSIALKKYPVLNNNKTFSHWKESQDPIITSTISKLYQDAQTELVSSAAGNSLFLKASGATVAAGILSHEIQESTTFNGTLQFVNIQDPGAGYTNGTYALTIGAPPAGGVQATGTYTVTGGVITSTAITAAGSGYLAPPAITATLGTPGRAGTVIALMATWDCAHFLNSTLMNVNKAQADPDTLELQFESIGYPTFDNTPL